MQSPLLLLADHESHASSETTSNILTSFLMAIERHSITSPFIVNKQSANRPLDSAKDEKGKSKFANWLALFIYHRHRLYLSNAYCLSQHSDVHSYYMFMIWCEKNNLFIHPALIAHRRSSEFRDHYFTVQCDLPRLTPLLAIPESLIIGLKEVEKVDECDSNLLHDSKRSKEFNKANSGENSSADICEFFFSSLGMLVEELIGSKSSPLTDARYGFAESLTKVRTLSNAPYFEDDVVFGVGDTNIADVLLQMIRNYINGGPLVNKVERSVLCWAVSLALSHSTPLSVGFTKSIGILPFVHLFPHGGRATNSYLVSRTGRSNSPESMNAFFKENFALDLFSHTSDQSKVKEQYIYLVPYRSLKAGEEVQIQAMAPVCDTDTESEEMWRLSCGKAPSDFLSSKEVAHVQHELSTEIIRIGELLLKGENKN